MKSTMAPLPMWTAGDAVFVLMQLKVGIEDVPKKTLCTQEALFQTGKASEEFNNSSLYLPGLVKKNLKEFASQRSPATRCRSTPGDKKLQFHKCLDYLRNLGAW